MIVLITLGLVLSSGTPQQQIIQNYVDNTEDIPALTRYGYIESIGIEPDLEEEIEKATDELISRYEAMYQINTNLTLADQSIRGSVYYLSSTVWNELSQNGTYDLITFERTDDVDIEDLEQVHVEVTDSNYTFSTDHVTELQTDLDIISGYNSGSYTWFDETHVSLILPMTAYPDKILSTEDNTLFREFFFIEDQHLNNAEDLSEVENQITGLDGVVAQVWQDIDHNLRSFDYPLLQHLYSEENTSYEDFFILMTISIPKIIFIQILVLYGLHLLMRRFFDQFELLYTRGLSLAEIKRQVILYSSLLPSLPIVFPLLASSQFNSIQLQLIYSILVPWMALYFFTSMWVITRQLRKFEEMLNAHTIAADEEETRPYHKIALAISMLYLARSILFKLGWQKDYDFAGTTDIFVPSDLGMYLSWALTFAAVGTLLYLFEGTFIKRLMSSSLSVKMWFSRIMQKRGIVMLFLVILTLNFGFDSVTDITVRTDQFIDDIHGGMGDYWVDFWTSDGNQTEGLKDKVGNISQLQSYLPLYRSYFEEINPNHGKSSQYGITLVNQTLYDNFTCLSCDTIEKEEFFADKIWVPERDYAAFDTQNDPFQITLENNQNITLNPDEFAKLDQKTGILVRASNTIIMSQETWLDHGYPTYDELAQVQYLILSFHDQPSVEEATTRVVSALGVDPNAIKVRSTTETTQYNSFGDNLEVVFYLNLIFAFFIGLTLSHLILGDTFLRDLAATIRRRYGNYNRLGLFMVLTHGLLLFIPVLSYLLAQNMTLFGIRDNYWDYQFYKRDWSNNLLKFGLILLTQAVAQITYSLVRRYQGNE